MRGKERDQWHQWHEMSWKGINSNHKVKRLNIQYGSTYLMEGIHFSWQQKTSLVQCNGFSKYYLEWFTISLNRLCFEIFTFLLFFRYSLTKYVSVVMITVGIAMCLIINTSDKVYKYNLTSFFFHVNIWKNSVKIIHRLRPFEINFN